jgi:hypothetical protein
MKDTVIDALPALKRWAASAFLVACALPAHAGLFDSWFGNKASTPTPAKVDPAQRLWRIGEFTTVQLVPREPGAAENQHPARVAVDALRWQLGGVRVIVNGASVALFAGDEINDITEPLAQAFAAAGPGDDVALLSTSRRGASFLTTPTGVTARLFVQDGALQLIVRDARLEFVKDYINSRAPLTFTYGSRSTPGGATLSQSAATVKRPDWLALPLTLPGAAPVASASPAVVPAGVAAAVASPAAVAATPAPAAVPQGPMSEVEYRLQTLKRLRDRGLISEEEFQEKRREVLKQF